MKMGVGEYLWGGGERYCGGFVNEAREGKGRIQWGTGEHALEAWWRADVLNGDARFWEG